MNFTICRALQSDKTDIINVLKHWNMHHAFTAEPDKIDLSKFFIAKIEKKIVGVAGYNILSDHEGQTRLLAVFPEFQGTGIGKSLQNKRLEEMYAAGVKKVVTHADRPDVILWYKKHYGYKEVGKVEKRYEIGLSDNIFAVVLELNLNEYMLSRKNQEKSISNYMATNDPYPLSPYPPLIINAALTGVVPTKVSTPHVPISTDEIIEDAIRVCDAGASIVHLHSRDNNGSHTNDTRYFETIITAIKKSRPELICCVTTSGRNGKSFEERSEVLHLSGLAKPDMASLTLGSLNFLSGPSINSLETVQRLALLMQEKGIKPELEVFDSGMINVAKYLERHNLINGAKYFNILLGNINTAAATIHELAHISSVLPENSIWAVAGLGGFQLPMNIASIVAGGHVRVGLEDNIYYDTDRNVLATNEMLIKRLTRVAGELQRAIATPKQARMMLDLNKSYK